MAVGLLLMQPLAAVLRAMTCCPRSIVGALLSRAVAGPIKSCALCTPSLTCTVLLLQTEALWPGDMRCRLAGAALRTVWLFAQDMYMTLRRTPRRGFAWCVCGHCSCVCVCVF